MPANDSSAPATKQDMMDLANLFTDALARLESKIETLDDRLDGFDLKMEGIRREILAKIDSVSQKIDALEFKVIRRVQRIEAHVGIA